MTTHRSEDPQHEPPASESSELDATIAELARTREELATEKTYSTGVLRERDAWIKEVVETREELAKVTREHDRLVERSVGAMHIAEGEPGHEAIPRDCPMLVAVSDLRAELEAERNTRVKSADLALVEYDRLRKRVKRLEEALRTCVEFRDLVDDYEGPKRFVKRQRFDKRLVDTALAAAPEEKP